MEIIFLTEYRGQTCWNQDFDGSQTKTEFKLNIDRDCSGELTTLITETDQNGQCVENGKCGHQIHDACYGDCQIPECPENKEIKGKVKNGELTPLS